MPLSSDVRPHLRTLKQLIREFWLPLIAAVSWTAYALSGQHVSQLSVRDIGTVFGPSFFLASWLASQWYRVRKQQKVEGGLESIEASVKRTLADLEVRTNDLIGHVTGGQSYCFIIGGAETGDRLQPLMVVHHGRHPLYDVGARIVDLQAFGSLKQPLSLEATLTTELHLTLGNMAPGFATMRNEGLNLGNGDARRARVQYFLCRQEWRLHSASSPTKNFYRLEASN